MTVELAEAPQAVGAALTSPHPAAAENHVSTALRYRPEENKFQTILVDLTHRCNMGCANCYIPNRSIPDMNADWLYGVLKRLPARARIRLSGGEPTLREDLPEICLAVREAGHTPILMTNGLKIADPGYLATLKKARLRSVYLSFSGGWNDGFYKIIDGMPCADLKARALENLVEQNFYISLGMILARGVNESEVAKVYAYALEHETIREFHMRAVGEMGRFMKTRAFSMDELVDIFVQSSGIPKTAVSRDGGESYYNHYMGHLKCQLTVWPDLGNPYRGRLAPDGTIQPFMEHVIANDGGY